jgi:hypothetical protein
MARLFFAVALSLLCLSACADLEVNVRQDKVVLKDGTEIECIVLVVTSKGVLIVEPDPKEPEKTRQRIVPAEQVQKIVRGEPDGTVTGFQTEAELAHKVIQGTGFRKPEPSKPKTAKPDTLAGPQVPVKIEPKSGKASLLTAGSAQASNSKLAARDLGDTYLSRFPVLKNAAQSLLGLERVAPLIESAQKGDPLARRQVESFLKLFLRDASALNEKAAANTGQPVKPVKQPKPTRAPEKK